MKPFFVHLAILALVLTSCAPALQFGGDSQPSTGNGNGTSATANSGSTINTEGFAAGDWYVMPSRIVLRGVNSSSQGYRSLVVDFKIKNSSNQVSKIPWPLFGGILVHEETHGYQYYGQMQIDNDSLPDTSFTNAEIPPGVVVLGQDFLNVPNDIGAFDVQFYYQASGQPVLTIQVQPSSMQTGSSGDMYIDLAAASIANLGLFEGSAARLSQVATITDYAEVTLDSVLYNSDSGQLEFAFQVKNLYGYSLRQSDARLELISDQYVFEFSQNTDAVIAPGEQSSWTFGVPVSSTYIPDPRGKSWIIVLLQRRVFGDPNPNPTVTTIHYITPQDMK